MNAIIVDDNKIARATLVQIASRFNEITILGEAADAIEAINLIRLKNPDLLLLDIEMPGMSGVDLIHALGNKKPLIIFTTSKKEYAIEAFDLNVVDFLLKPILPARFIQAIHKAKEALDSKKINLSNEGDHFLFIRDGNIIKRISIHEILYAEAMGDYVKIYITDHKYCTIHCTLKSLEDRLGTENFFRVHRSYIIAIDKIESIKEGVINIGDKAIPIADAYRSALNQRLRVV